MKTVPVPVRLDNNLQKMLRMTLRRHLREVIEEEALVKSTQRITNIEPWPQRVVEEAYRRMGKDWDAVETAATRAQGKPDFND